MEEFLNLNWSWKKNRITSSALYDVKFSDDEKDIFVCHLNEIDHIHLLDRYGKNGNPSGQTYQVKDPRTGKEVIKQTHDHSKNKKTLLFQNFPQKSSMDSKLHSSCINAISKLKFDQNFISMIDRNDIRIYNQFYDHRSKEKKEFLQFVKGEFFKRNIKNCQNLRPEFDKFITKKWKESIKNAIESNDNFYRLQSAIPIKANGCGGDEITIEFEKTLSENGAVLAINRNKYNNPLQLSCSFLEYFFGNCSQVPLPTEQTLLNEKVNVAIRLSTLASLLCYTNDFSLDWNLTFSLKERNNDKIIVFDEILPTSILGCLDKNRMAYKFAVTAEIVVPMKRESFTFEENCFVQEERPIFNESPPSILSYEPTSSYKLWEFEDYLNKFGDSHSTIPTTNGGNYRHQLYNIKRNKSECCRLVISNSQDVCEKQSDGDVQFINLSPKVDYQYEFGAEQMTLTELISEWCELRFGPNTTTDRVRIDATTSTIHEAKQITIEDVEFDLKRIYNINKELLLVPLLNIIQIIKNFPLNEYLLRHKSNNGEQALVYVKCANDSLVNTLKIADIYESHKSDSSNLEIIPWNPIDDMVCTSIHKYSNLMPCAFPHWGQKRRIQSDDRSRLVQRAEQKMREKSDAILKRNANIKKQKKLKKRKEKKIQLAITKKTELKFEGDFLDPNELFDETGNIQLASFTNNERNDLDTDKDDSISPICYASYQKDAAINSDNSQDSN